jgi:RHS repeat-associated protein
VTDYQYDAKGNLTAKVENGATQAGYEWNAKGELVAVEVTENGQTGRMEFEYDHNGIRLAMTVDGEETRFLIDTNQQEYAQVIEEYTPDGDVINAYTYGWDLISQDDGTDRVYYQVDGLGSTRNITDINGDVVVEYTFDAYGNLINQVGDSDNNYLFTGEQFDNEIGLNYNRARYYDPNTGRFISRDPFDGFNDIPLTLHDYLYAGANPIINIDPSGNFVEYKLTSDTRKVNAASLYARYVGPYRFLFRNRQVLELLCSNWVTGIITGGAFFIQPLGSPFLGAFFFVTCNLILNKISKF